MTGKIVSILVGGKYSTCCGIFSGQSTQRQGSAIHFGIGNA